MEADVRVFILLLGMAVASVRASTEYSLRGVGASFPKEVYNAWIGTQLSTRNDWIELSHEYTSAGSSFGKSSILNANQTYYQYAGTDVDFTDAEKQNPNYPSLYTLPTLAGAIVMAYNLPGLTERILLTRDEIVGIFDGTITRWNDSKLVASNPGIALPNQAILPVVRSDGSGSTSTFTAGLSSFSSAWRNRVINGQNVSVFKTKDYWDATVIKYYGLKNSGVAGLIASIEYTIGYVSIADAKEYPNVIRMAYVRNRQGNKTDPEELLGLVSAMSVATADLTRSIVDSPSLDAYPLASNTYMVVYKHYNGCPVAIELLRYLNWVFFEGNDAAVEAKSRKMVIPGKEVREIIRSDILQKITCGEGKDNVWVLMSDQMHEEAKRLDSWYIPVLVLVPLTLLILSAVLGYAIFQKVKMWRMINSNEWDIPIEDILFYFNSKNRTNSKLRTNRSFTSLDSENWSQIEEGNAIVDQVLQWPGKWNAHTIGIRLMELKEFKVMRNKTKRMLLWMRDTIIHHNVLRFHGLTMVDDERYCVSEYCAKGPMLDILQDEKFNINNDIKFSLATDIVTGMSYLSSHGIVHGNLRSACCLVDSRWQVKISDWEYVHLYSTLKNNKKTSLREMQPDRDEIGDFAAHYRKFWTAPEILRNDYDLQPNSACDMYSFSIMLHEIFSREDPYSEHADTMEPKAIISAVVQNNLRPMHSDDTPVSIRQIMEIAWVEDPSARPSFEQIQKMLKHANPTKKNMLDSMLEAMEEYSIHLEDRVHERTSELQIAKEQAESVLLNIMPSPIARKVMNQEDIDAREHASIGIVAFELSLTNLCENKDSTATIELLNRIHNEMDSLIRTKADTFRQQLFGDMVICLTGMTKRVSKKHVCRAAQLCLELVDFLEKLRTENADLGSLRAVFGLHCGPVITGVMGQNSPQFVMYGEAIKCAVAMAYASQPSRILVSENCCKVLQNTGQFTMEPAHDVEMKNNQVMKASWLVSSDGRAVHSHSDTEPEPEVRYTEGAGNAVRNGFTPISAV